MVVSMSTNSNFIQKASNARSWASLATWIYDLVASNWSAIAAFLISTGLLGWLAAITEWALRLGPIGIGAIAVFGGLVVNLLLAAAQRLRASAREKALIVEFARERAKGGDAINPLDNEFHRKRVKIEALAHPLRRTVSKKRFTDCQLVGPANILIQGGGTYTNMQFSNCDFIVPKDNVALYNIIVFDDVTVIGGEFMNTTIYVTRDVAQTFFRNTAFITLTGDPNLDANRIPTKGFNLPMDR
jgi:hypothetical protein